MKRILICLLVLFCQLDSFASELPSYEQCYIQCEMTGRYPIGKKNLKNGCEASETPYSLPADPSDYNYWEIVGKISRVIDNMSDNYYCSATDMLVRLIEYGDKTSSSKALAERNCRLSGSRSTLDPIQFTARVVGSECRMIPNYVDPANSPFSEGDFIKGLMGSKKEIQKHELTYAQWTALSADLPKGSRAPWKDEAFCNSEYITKGFGPNHPAACISQNDAEAFVAVLNSMDDSYTYSLPTDRELGGLIDSSALSIDYYDLRNYAWYSRNSGDHAHEVCTKDTIFGLCDILGNLRERTGTQAPPPFYEGHVVWGSDFGSIFWNKQDFYGSRASSAHKNTRDVVTGVRLMRKHKSWKTQK